MHREWAHFRSKYTRNLLTAGGSSAWDPAEGAYDAFPDPLAGCRVEPQQKHMTNPTPVVFGTEARNRMDSLK